VQNGATLVVNLANGSLASSAGGDIICCNILVKGGGHLIVSDGADARFAANVTVENYGTWSVGKDATLRFGDTHSYQCRGSLGVDGFVAGSGQPIHWANIRAYEGVPTLLVGARPNQNAGGSATFWLARDSAVRIIVNKASIDCRQSRFIAPQPVAWPTQTRKFCCIDAHDVTASSQISACRFYAEEPRFGGPAFYADTAVVIADNMTGAMLVSTDTAAGFATGISAAGGRYEVASNIVDSCAIGIDAHGSTLLPDQEIIHDNLVRRCGTGAWVRLANSYFYSNDIGPAIPGVQSRGVRLISAAPFLACNRIHEHAYGITSSGGSNPNLSSMWFLPTNPPAVNSIDHNTTREIDIEGGDMIIDNGQNTIDRGTSATDKLIGPNAPPSGAVYQARQNYWGTNACLPPPGFPTACFDGWWATPTNWNWVAPIPNAASCQASVGGNLQDGCLYWTQYFDDQSGYFGTPCDSLIALYDREITCGRCESAIEALEQAIDACDDVKRETLKSLLRSLTSSVVHCYGRTAQPLADEVSWLRAYAAAADSAYKQHAATWEIGQVFGAMQCFDSAAELYTSIAAAGWSLPEDSASAADEAAFMAHERDIEGNADLCGAMGKRSARGEYRGRVGVTTPKDPLLMETYPNPFARTTEIAFTLPDDDRVEVKVYNQSAEDVTTLMSGAAAKGRHAVRFDAAGLPPGVYYIAVHTQTEQESRAIVLRK
jgi:hypothetical protein